MSSSDAFRIAFRCLSVRYPDRATDALVEVSETIEEGDVVAVAGPSGCGKTTLCLALAGVVPGMIPARVTGDVALGGRPVAARPPEELASAVGLVQQDPDAQICTLGVEQEVAFGPENLRLATADVRRRVDDALAALRIEHLRGRLTTTLSAGEKQRLAIAAILAMEPDVLILDEPTASLDPRGILDFFELLRRWVGRRTLLIVEHRIDALRSLTPRLVLLDRGRLVDRYPTRERLDYAKLGLRGAWAAKGSSELTSEPLVGLERVSFDYGDPLLRDLSLSFDRGTITAILGPNGGGKTTLLRLLAGLESPRAGRIRRAGARVGFVFQHPHRQIFERTVGKEMALGHPEPSRLGRDLAAAGLSGLEAATPLSLSFGEQRRLTISTTLATSPDLLLLDEPFAGQDRRNVLWIIESLRDVARRGGSVAFVTHDITLAAALADRVLYLERGRWCHGAPEHVFDWVRAKADPAFAPEEST